MRYINLQLMIGDELAADALKAAEAACDEILGEKIAAKREQLIKAHRPKWVAFREHFERIYGAKCWYTECENPGTDDDIDHYRPKGRIFEDKTHGGYWWEALNWRNFRLSCHRANRPRENPETGQTHGKADHFPLVDPAGRWRKAKDTCHEKPLLLDPVRAGDPNILTFFPNGKVALAPKFEQDAEAKLRFEASRTFLHLDWPAIRQGRQMLYADIARRVDDGNQAASSIAQGDPKARLWLDRVVGGLIELAQPKMPYSRAAQAYIRCHRARPWVEAEVLPHILHVEPVAEEIAA